MIRTGLLALLLCFSALSGFAATNKIKCSESNIFSGFESDLFYRDPKGLLTELRKTPMNTIATTIVWSVVEKKPGQIDLAPYFPQLDALTNAGYCLILLIDTSGRRMRHDIAARHVKDLDTIPERSRPDWINADSLHLFSRDFFDGPSESLDFNHPDVVRHVTKLYSAISPALAKRYGKHIVAISPCITTECEIKYTQNGFRWESYSKTAQDAFAAYLKRNDLPPGGMPIMSYPNQLNNGNPKPERMYPALQAFREDSLRQFVCDLTRIIGQNKLKSIAYFGQPFSFVDGIYATGVIEKTSHCFDIAAIDYNFYNGYGVEFKPDIPNFIVSYAVALGYKQVLVGLYMERFRNHATGQVSEQGYELLERSFHNVALTPNVAGVEVGNLTGREFERLDYIRAGLAKPRDKQPPKAAKTTVSLYASIQNSYLWQGEWSNDRQIIQDNLIANYVTLVKAGHAVQILTDRDFLTSSTKLKSSTVIVLPHLTAMPDQARDALIDHIKAGGKILADMRADEYRADGAPRRDGALRQLLGMTQVSAFQDNIMLVRETETVSFTKQRQYVNGFLLAPSKGFLCKYRKSGGKGEGLILQGPNSTVFGFMPLLMEGPSTAWAQAQYVAELDRLLKQ